MREGPETTQPKETQGESLESRDYATQREGGGFQDSRLVSS